MVRREHAVVAGQVHPGTRHQGGQTGQEIQRLEQHVRRAVAGAMAGSTEAEQFTSQGAPPPQRIVA
jgi:hypothetical protein